MPSINEIREQFPMYADMSDGDLVRGLHKKFYADIPYQDFLRKIDFSQKVDPTKDMSGGQKFAAGAGKAFYDLARGAGQIAGVTSQEDVNNAKELDAPLMKTGAGVAGNIAGNAAMFAPTAMIPGANTYTGAALGGAAMGALQPVADGESRTANATVGALAGAGGQAIGNAIGRVIKPVASRLGPEEQALANAAAKEGIPLTAGQKTGSRPLQVMESVLENLPLTSGSQLAQKEAQQRAFTAAALKRAGIDASSATPEVLLNQKKALGETLENLAKQNELDFNKGLVDKLAQITADASRRGETAAAPVTNIVDNLLKEVGQNGKMTGETYQAWRQMLRPLAKGQDGHYYSEIRKALDAAFNEQIASVNPVKGLRGDAHLYASNVPKNIGTEWQQANRQYANLKTLMNAAGGPGATAATNQIAPAQLAAALRQAMGKEGIALGQGDLNQLSRIGTKFVKDQIPNSGTAQRQFVQQLLTGGAGTIPGAGVGYMAGGPEGAATGAVAGAGLTLGGPKIAQMLLNSKAGQAYLTKGIASLSDAQRAALANALRTGMVGAAPVLSQ